MPSETHQVNITNYLGFNPIKMIVKTNYHNHLSLNYDLKLIMPKNILSPKSLTHMSIYKLTEKKPPSFFVRERHSFGNSLQLPCLLQKINLSPLFLAVLVLTTHSLYYELYPTIPWIQSIPKHSRKYRFQKTGSNKN